MKTQQGFDRKFEKDLGKGVKFFKFLLFLTFIAIATYIITYP